MPTHENGVPEQPASDSQPGNGGSDNGAPVPQPELPRWANKSQVATPFSESRMAAYIGPRWETTYRKKLAVFFADPAFTVTWNWSAFIVGPLWFLYRKLYLAFGMFFVASQVLSGYLLMGFERTQFGAAMLNPENRPVLITIWGLVFTIHLAAGGTANWWLFRRARMQSLIVTLQQVPEDVAITRLQRVGGVALLPVVLLLLVQFAFNVAAVLAPAG